MNYELLKNITVSIFSILVAFGLIIFYWKVLRISIKIKSLNKEIEEQKSIFNNKEVKSIKSDNDWDLEMDDNKKDKQEKRKIEHKIEKLERKKKYLLEEISIYKLFKK